MITKSPYQSRVKESFSKRKAFFLTTYVTLFSFLLNLILVPEAYASRGVKVNPVVRQKELPLGRVTPATPVTHHNALVDLAQNNPVLPTTNVPPPAFELLEVELSSAAQTITRMVPTQKTTTTHEITGYDTTPANAQVSADGGNRKRKVAPVQQQPATPIYGPVTKTIEVMEEQTSVETVKSALITYMIGSVTRQIAMSLSENQSEVTITDGGYEYVVDVRQGFKKFRLVVPQVPAPTPIQVFVDTAPTPVRTPMPVPTPEPTPTPVPAPESTTESTPESKPEPTTEPTSEPTPALEPVEILSLDGTGLGTTDVVGLNPSASFAIAYYMRINAPGAPSAYTVQNIIVAGTMGHDFKLGSDGEKFLFLADDEQTVLASSRDGFDDNKFHHVVGYHDGTGKFTLYVDAIEQ